MGTKSIEDLKQLARNEIKNKTGDYEISICVYNEDNDLSPFERKDDLLKHM